MEVLQVLFHFREIINYVEENTGKHAILSDDGEVAPYNGEPEYSINTEKAEKKGYHFSNLKRVDISIIGLLY